MNEILMQNSCIKCLNISIINLDRFVVVSLKTLAIIRITRYLIDRKTVDKIIVDTTGIS